MKPSRWPLTLQVALFAMSVLPHGAACGNAGIAVWDTGKPSAQPLTPAALAEKDGWTRVPRNETASFEGDAVITNGPLLVVWRQRNPAADVYSVVPQGAVSRVRLRLVAADGGPATHLERVSLVENSRGAARLEASYGTAKGGALVAKFRLKRGDVSLEVEPGPGAGRLRVECPGRFVVLPDFFADDILINAGKIPVPAIEVPSENFLLHLTGGGNAIAMCVFENREQDVKVSLSGKGNERIVTGSEIDFGGDRKIWVALMEAAGVWHQLHVRAEDAKKVRRLDWKMPFAAQWRIDFTRKNDLSDSWELLLQKERGRGYLKPTWIGRGALHVPADRKRWTTVLGWFQYPCWTDHQGHGYVQPFEHRALTFRGPAVIYPVHRVQETPIDAYTVVDIVRNTLGVGPCEYILNVEGQKQEKKGRATCAARDALHAIYRKNQQKRKRREVEEALDDALAFVTHIRNRIQLYVEFGREVRKYLAAQRDAHPELKEHLSEMEKIAQEIDIRMASRRQRIREPGAVAEMNDAFRKNLLGYDGADAFEKVKAYTDQLTRIGGNQDELVGECRWIVRTLRQRAGLLMAVDPRCGTIAQEIRARTREVLLKPATYEGARH